MILLPPNASSSPETGIRTDSESPAWFCVRTHPKHEHIAAASLRKDLEVETFLPRVRCKRSTARGSVWFTDALFPTYLFARFALKSSALAVQYSRGVRGIVHFGDKWPAVPDTVIAELQSVLGHAEIYVIHNRFTLGDAVEIAGGPFHGLRAVVTRVMPSQERIAVLLDFLGRQTTLELRLDSVVRPSSAPTNLW